jgi:hypothetical protein
LYYLQVRKLKQERRRYSIADIRQLVLGADLGVARVKIDCLTDLPGLDCLTGSIRRACRGIAVPEPSVLKDDKDTVEMARKILTR